MPARHKPFTLAVHAGTRVETRSKPIAPAIHVSSVSYYERSEDLDRSLDGADFVYSRIKDANVSLLEEAIAALEGAGDCAAYPSGMAALRGLLEAQALGAKEAAVIPSDCYGMTRALCKAHCASRGVALHSVNLAEARAAEEIQRLRPRLVLAESITNPLLAIPDLPALAQACKQVGAVLAVDATFATPALQQPLQLGADYVLHSTTKWINGHSDAMGGVVSANAERVRALKAARVMEGAILGPFEAYLTLRGLRTLLVRMRAHCENAERIAHRLASAPSVERVLYPGLSSHSQHGVAKRVLSRPGAMLSFEIRGASRAHAFRFLEAVKLARPAPSLGDVGTLVMHAASAASRRMTPEERAAAGIHENLIRVSVGLEDPDDVADDLLAAVAQAMAAAPA